MAFTKFIVRPAVAGSIAVVSILGFGLSLLDSHFMHIVGKPDNIPITIMLVLVGYLTWHSLKRGVENDRREEAGEPLLEKEQSKRSMTWPNLVYIEFICLILVTVFLIFWSVGFQAPIEEPANPNLTPNPSKAPWYFLGLQEMLVYFDPWLAGVVYPGLIVAGLAAIPYIDPNKKGNGYYTIKHRKFAISTFLFGFIVQWVLLIILGTFMRGPGWNFFGPFETWDPHKVEALVNINLSELLWVKMLGMGLPKNILIRESLGLFLCGAYLVVLPVVMGKTVFKTFKEQLGNARYYVMVFLFISLMSLPIKMLLRWTMNLKYIVAIPEFFFNI